MDNCTAFVLKTPKAAGRPEPQSPSQVQALRKKFDHLLAETNRKADADELQKLRSRSTSLAYHSTHKESPRLPELPNRNTLMEAVKERINLAQKSPVKGKAGRYKGSDPLIPMSLPRPVYAVLEGLNVKPPEPKVKFYELLETPPFNRAHKEDLMTHFLLEYKYLSMHPEEVLRNISGRVTLERVPFPPRALWVVEHGTITVGGVNYGVGELANEKLLAPKVFEFTEEYEASEGCRVLAIPKYDYQSFLALYMDKHSQHFSSFIRESPTLKMVAEETVGRLAANLSCRFLLPGALVYRVGDPVSGVYFVYSGRVFRRVIVSLDQHNRIPVSHSQHLLKTCSKSYEFKIRFEPAEMLGYTEIINAESLRNEQIEVQSECMLLHVGLNAFADSIDEHTVNRLREQKSKKYPDDYDGLCQRFAQEKQDFSSTEKTKIAALAEGCRYGPPQDVEKKSRRIQRFISKSVQRIRDYERLALVRTKNTQTLVKNLMG